MSGKAAANRRVLAIQESEFIEMSWIIFLSNIVFTETKPSPFCVTFRHGTKFKCIFQLMIKIDVHKTAFTSIISKLGLTLFCGKIVNVNFLVLTLQFPKKVY